MSRMKAVVYYGPEDIRIEQMPVPNCNENELLIKVDACAVCGTDLKSYRSGNPRIKAPLVIGHEFTGLIETCGVNVEGFEVGDRIVMATSISCGKCLYCRKGWRNLCENIAPMGFSYAGGMAEFTVIPEEAINNGHVIIVPENVPAEQATLAEPLSCAVNAVSNTHIQQGDTVVIMGAGPMGLMNVAVAKSFGAGKIILSEISAERLKQANDFDIDILVNPEHDDLVSVVRNTTEGYGADIVIVAAPAAFPQEMAVELVRKKGTVCLFASLPVGKEMLTINSRTVHYREIMIVGSSDSTPDNVKQAVQMISGGSMIAGKLVTHILKFDEIFQAFDLMEKGKSLRVVLQP